MDDEEKARLVAELEREGLMENLQLELTWQRLIAIGWLILWRYCVGLLAIFSVLDLVWRKFFGGGFVVAGAEGIGVNLLALTIAVALAVLWGVAVVHTALIKRYRLTGFRLIVVPR
jgi:hypothetical protein